jgi:hypothetical protein
VNNNVISHRVPVPIITVSTFSRCQADDTNVKRYGQSGPPLSDRLKEMMPMARHLVELTPQTWGSTVLGYSSTFPFEIRTKEKWARIASAAVDAPGYRRCEDLRALGITFGDFTPTPATANLSLAQQEEIYVADGGFVDNLAARNLIERGCKSLLISDAEHDPSLLFEAYLRLKADLAIIGQRLVVKPIDQWLEQRGLDPCPKTGSCFQADNPNNPLVTNAAFEGCITKGLGCDSEDEIVSRITYLKLTVDPNVLRSGRMKRQIAEYYERSSNRSVCTEERGKDLECSFPHTPTFKTNFSADEFRAYRFLGEDLVRLNSVASKFLRH